MSVVSVARTDYKTILLDLIAIAVITFLPALSHFTSLPLYEFEPMRVILVLSLMFTTRRNSYIIALVLPLFSHLISAHPAFIKLFLISSELLINLYLFSLIEKKSGIIFISLFSSILISKGYYYILKYSLLSAGMMNGELVSTPLYLQVIIAVLLSLGAHIYINKGIKKL
jgi:hypothetical protein